MNKQEARAIALANRKTKDKIAASSRVLDAIISSNSIDKYQHIGIYYPIGREIDIMPLIDKYPEKCFYLPITRNEISFLRYKKGEPLVPGEFHTMEPVGEIIDRDQIECFLVPCVACSRDYRRIGYGKGYYDRYLEKYKGYLIGILYKEDIYDVCLDPFDIQLNEIIVG